MSADKDLALAADVTFPMGGAVNTTAERNQVRKYAISTTPIEIDLQAAFGDRWKTKFVRLCSDVAFVFFNSATTGETISLAATDATNVNQQGEYVPAGAEPQGKCLQRYIMVDGTAAGLLTVSLRNPPLANG